jgi:capsular exopolysaccharide synthesis family protein
MNDALNLKDQLGIYWPKIVRAMQRHWLIAVVTFLAIGLSLTIITLRQRNIYQSECKIEFTATAPDVSLDNRSLLRYSSYVLQNFFLKSQRIIIRSEPVLSRIVSSLELADPNQDAEKFASMQRQVAGALEVEQIPETQIFLLKARHSDPKLAMQIANTAAEAYLRYSYDKKIEGYRNSTDWMDEKLVDIKAKLELAQRDLINFIEKEKLTNFAPENRTESTRENSGAPMLSSDAAHDNADTQGLLKILYNRKVEEELKLQRLQEKYLPAHPEYQRVVAEINLLDRKITEEESRLKTMKLAHNQETIRGKKNEIQYSILNREVEINKELYNALIRKHKEADISSAIVQTDANIIEKAKLPSVPIYPHKSLQILLSWLLGLLISLGYCMLMEYSDSTLQSIKDLEIHLGQLPLAVIPKRQTAFPSTTSEIPGMISDDDPYLGEAFRVLRTNLNFSFPKGDSGRVMMVGSTRKGEGKTTVSMNLAKMSAEQDRRTLLIDADLRARSLSRYFNLQNEVGLTSYLIGEVNSSAICQPTGIKNLSIISAGHEPPQPSTLLDSKAMQELVKKLRFDFDEIIIDAPPLGVVIDSSIIASMADGVIIVAEVGVANRHEVKRAIANLQKLSVRLCGIVLNKFVGKVEGYGYGHNYHVANSSNLITLDRSNNRQQKS